MLRPAPIDEAEHVPSRYEDRLLHRVAELSRQLRRVTFLNHTRASHRGKWIKCEDDECMKSRKLLESIGQ